MSPPARHLALLLPNAPARLAWAQRHGPLVSAVAEDALVWEVTGLTHLAGGEAGWLARVQADAAQEAGGHPPALLGGPWPGLVALLRGGITGRVLTAEEQAHLLADLPVGLLGLPEEMVQALFRLGLRRVGEVLAQPRAPLARRFPGLLPVLDAAVGRRPCPLSPQRPPPRHALAEDFPTPVCTRPAIEAALDRLLRKLCAGLLAAGEGARRLRLSAQRADGTVQALVAGTGQASRQPAHWARLFRDKLEGLQPEEGFDRLRLEALAVEPLPPQQEELAERAAPQALAELLDRLAQRLPLWRWQMRPSHWPERALQRLPPHATPTPCPLPCQPRPVRLLRRPLPLSAVALLPDGPPVLLRLHGRAYRVLHATGPERIAPEWWRPPPLPPPRDYYAVQTAEGARWWVCRSGPPGEEGRWWLHGLMP
ncbi:MAG: DNA polymerase Y family protein [Rhodovarius sp.]|nr:DNA polymerase Y family protein [Rhodovarius sp.]